MMHVKVYKILGVILFLAVIYVGVLSVARLGSPFGVPGAREHHLNRDGMFCLRDFLETNTMVSFAQFFDVVKARSPDKTSNVDAPNPFPGILLAEHTYARVLELPKGLPLDKVPLIWDTKPGYEGWVAVLFWDGNLPEIMDMKHLEQIVKTVKQHGGRVSEGKHEEVIGVEEQLGSPIKE